MWEGLERPKHTTGGEHVIDIFAAGNPPSAPTEKPGQSQRKKPVGWALRFPGPGTKQALPATQGRSPAPDSDPESRWLDRQTSNQTPSKYASALARWETVRLTTPRSATDSTGQRHQAHQGRHATMITGPPLSSFSSAGLRCSLERMAYIPAVDRDSGPNTAAGRGHCTSVICRWPPAEPSGCP